MNIALVQINPVVGAFERNLQAIQAQLTRAQAAACDLAILPELALCGAPPLDLLERPAFFAAHSQALSQLMSFLEALPGNNETQQTGMVCMLGVLEQDEPHPEQHGARALYSSALALQGKTILGRARRPGALTAGSACAAEGQSENSALIKLPGLHCLLTMDEVTQFQGRWSSPPARPALGSSRQEADLLVMLGAAPYYHGELQTRQQHLAAICRAQALPLLFVNQVCCQDGLLFDGHSLALDAAGELRALAAGFAEDALIVDDQTLRAAPEAASAGQASARPVLADGIEQVERALIFGLRDHLQKSGFTRAVLGLSGGIDSAVVAALAAHALGPENLLCVSLPSPYTAQQSVDEARQLAAALGCDFTVLPIAGLMAAFSQTLQPVFAGSAEDLSEQNIQARIRGSLLMAMSNKFGRFLLSTGNKSELAVGYCTLYGDMCGGLGVIADLPKTLVYELARWLNREGEVIPEGTISRPPTAELKPNQFDQDDLPPYDLLDRILHAYLDERKSVAEIVAEGLQRELVQGIVRRIHQNEHKRKQAAPSLRISRSAFGSGCCSPLSHGFVD